MLVDPAVDIDIAKLHIHQGSIIIVAISPAVLLPRPKATASLGIWDNYRGGVFGGLWLYPRDVAVVLVSRELLPVTAVILWNATYVCWTTWTRVQLWHSLEDLDTS